MSSGPQSLSNWPSLDPAVHRAIDHLALLFQVYSREGLSKDWELVLTVEEQRRIEHESVWQLPKQLVVFASSDAALLYHNAHDFKYFLPRLMVEALSQENENLTSVLSYARAVALASWPQAERDAVAALLRAWWTQCLEQPVDFNSWPAEDALCGMALLQMDLSPVLNEWRINTGLNASLQLVETIRILLSKDEDALILDGYWEDCPAQAGQLQAWLLSEEVFNRVQEALQWVKRQDDRHLLEKTVQRLILARHATRKTDHER